TKIGLAFRKQIEEMLLLAPQLLFRCKHDFAVDGIGATMAGSDQRRLVVDQIANRLHMAVVLDVIAKDQVVAHSTVLTRIGEKSIAGKRHAVPVDRHKKRHLVFGVAGRVRDFEFELLPAELLPVTERPSDAERLSENTAKVMPARILKNVHHVLVTP